MDVGAWLRHLGLEQYEAAFHDNSVDARVLPRLTGDDLKELGITSVGHRRMLLDAISELKSARGLFAPASEAQAIPSPAETASPARVSEVAAERRPITVMFCDLVGSTGLAAKLDPEDWRSLVNAYLNEASAAVTALGGHVLKKLGDGLMALFGYPQAQENDAERAVRAALAIQHALTEINAKNRGKGAAELSVRIGIESGPVVVEGTGEVFGDAPNVAARVQAAAEPGSVLITLNVQRQVAGLFVAEEQAARELKGVSAPVQLFRIVRASGGGRRGGSRTLTPFVGREEELALLARRWDSVRSGDGQLVLIAGEPGLGKSRLLDEFHSQLTETPHTWSEWSASQLLQNTPLHPIAEWGRQRFGVDDAPAEQRLADLENTLRLVGLEPAEYAPLLAPLLDVPLPPVRAASFPPEELRRRQLSAISVWVLAGARSQPLVLAFEDLHWADPTSLDLLRSLAERGAQAPLLLLATARPEFRPPWSLRSHHSIVSLRPLDRAGVARMVGEISAQHTLSKDVIEGLSERTGGVPLFVEEVTRLLLERGEHGGVQAIPPTLQQSLAARLDRLGAAREVAQIGAVLGRDFAYTLLRGIADLDEPALHTSLDRLADADLLFVEGAPPQATYRFKHALIQDAAYDSLLKSRRQALHRRAAELLRDDPEHAAAEPEVIAHHFTQGGLEDLAIEWWGRAGDQALRRSAFQEAIAHLGKAIEMADKGVLTASTTQRVKLQAGYGLALTLSRGAATEETQAATARTQELVGQVNDAAARFAAYRAKFMANWMGGQIGSARLTAEAYLEEAKAAGGPWDTALAGIYLGQVGMVQGVFEDARKHLTEALDVCGGSPEMDFAGVDAADLRSYARAVLALVSWQLGEADRAQGLIEQAAARAVERRTGVIAAITLALAPWLEQLRGDAEATLRRSELLSEMAERSGFPDYSALAKTYRGWARARLGDPAAGVPEFRNGLAEITQKSRMGLPLNQGLLAELDADDPNAAIEQIEEALALAEQTDQRWTDAFLHRLRGDILLKRNPADPGPAEEAYRTAIAIAKEQGARSYVLLASLALAKLYQSTARPAEAHAVLAPALEGFSPTPKLPQIAEAQELLSGLKEKDDVKAAIAQRQRRLDLQTAYGHALMWGKGLVAEETSAAIARVGEFAGSAKNAAPRFAAFFAESMGSLSRGQLRLARETCETFLRDVEAEGRTTDAASARAVLGLVLLNQGELKAARSVLERALADCDPRPDGETGFRFWDAEVTATAELAATEWHLGEADRARELINRAVPRAEELSLPPITALALNWRAVLESQRHDVLATRNAADAMLALTEEHGLKEFADYNWAYTHWARGQLLDPEAGAVGFRQELAAFMDKGRRLGAPFYHGLLAELEAATRGPDSALTLIDHALAIAEETEQHLSDPYLHGLRGEILLRRDPSNPGPAEEAFQTALAIARQQGARSWGLRAALSFAKLYQSTNRPVEAHAVLAPALEGFAPTPEMPEIAEAHALLATLAETEEVKAAEEQRQRRLRLQTAYGQAVMWGKGYAAEETKAAFARAAELTERTDDFSARVVALQGQFSAAATAGELRSARELALTLLHEAEDARQPTEASMADNFLGLVAYWRGDCVEARTHYERALAALDPNHDPQVVGYSALASAHLAATMWQLGEVERARDLINSAIHRVSETGYFVAIADALFYKSSLEIWRGDPRATLSAAEALVHVARERGMVQYLNEAELHSGWARGRIDDPMAGTAQIRRVLTALVEQGVRINLGFYTGLLAELEAETLGANGALARIDEAFRLSNAVEHRCSLPFLHRLRGESCSSATQPIPLRLRKHSAPLSPSQRSRAHAAPFFWRRLPSQSCFNRLDAPLRRRRF
jgi:class 3 adenylate cyclase/tetratricopeptide (TPR) repeat protein